MAIIRYTKDITIKYAYLNIFLTNSLEKEKQDDSYIKIRWTTLQIKHMLSTQRIETALKKFDERYFTTSRFYQDEEVRSFTDVLEGDLKLPSYGNTIQL
jgi:hypothetical protein